MRFLGEGVPVVGRLKASWHRSSCGTAEATRHRYSKLESFRQHASRGQFPVSLLERVFPSVVASAIVGLIRTARWRVAQVHVELTEL